tara:strand:- start:11 stop:307 length:297 start_codon:yes stop_codon:yes gene_type:complete
MNAPARILPDLSAQLAMALERIAQLEQARATRKVAFRVTEPKLNKDGVMKGSKGAISAYGLGQFPITLYASQWERLIDAMPDLQAFMKANAASLTRKE